MVQQDGDPSKEEREASTGDRPQGAQQMRRQADPLGGEPLQLSLQHPTQHLQDNTGRLERVLALGDESKTTIERLDCGIEVIIVSHLRIVTYWHSEFIELSEISSKIIV